ncbi:hypothetical protein BGZ46_010388, partial [Entomortierella lignicola]
SSLSPSDLERHRQYVHTLWIGTLPPGLYAFHFPKLYSLFMRQVEGYSLDKSERCPIQLITLNSATLSNLELHGQNEYYTSEFWNAIGELPNLKSLCLDGSTIQKDRSLEFLKACLNLECLQLSSTSISLINDNFKDLGLKFPKMRQLALIFVGGLVGINQLELIIQCPILEELKWQLGGWHHSFELGTKFTRLITTERAWPKLERLGLTDGSGKVEDEVLASILDSQPRITMLDVHFTGFGNLGFQALGRHFGTLTILDVTKCMDFTSSMCLEILRSCPNLEEFSGERILVRDIAQSGPWSCLRLKKLYILFSADSSDQSLDEKVFEKLSHLVRLEELWVGMEPMFGAKPLNFQLVNGLGALATLTRLRSICIRGLARTFSETDLSWMLEHWRMLDDFQGLGTNYFEPQRQSRMVNLLKSHGLYSKREFA